ncbi:hypothetical protein THAOC_05115 [Thalassiosira oceanica]|uniref:Signal recognition particle receptor subunit beta n=1 Tax=Thalassiosira oceanica TaxID=159749 RepID=K0T6J3_THAOC|nr:hypothetical protein THAOC_05115 [Thalassiosira oceanica]|eukprot:EJK73270.1 hypothetical protein THAOC_05115 [Thalassiosira oceanica]
MATTRDGERASNVRPIFYSTRRAVAPLLPPPVLRAIHATDSHFVVHHASFTDEYLHSEPSVSILSAILLACTVWKAFQIVWTSSTSRSTAHLSKNEDTVLGNLVGASRDRHQNGDDGFSPPFKDTVVICGASYSGKTTLLYLLCSDGPTTLPMTVTSLVANVGYISSDDSIDGSAEDATLLRLIDYPGHPSLSSQLSSLLNSENTSRVIFAIDSSQSVADGAALLYKRILTNLEASQSWSARGCKMPVLVVCTKSDVKGSKNYKRMKIQIRNELDRLRKIDLELKLNSESSAAAFPIKGRSIDLDNLGDGIPIALHFVESGIGDGGIDVIKEFVLTGALPEERNK